MSVFRDFAAALRAPDARRPQGALNPGGKPSVARYDVYRNNVATSLIEALATGFPVVRQLVGEEFFSAMAREFVLLHPPKDPVIVLWGAGFPDWLETFAPIKAVPYVPGIARLEYLRRQAFHAADVEPLEPAMLAGVAPDALAAQRLLPHPSARWMADPMPILSIWQRHQEDADDIDPPAGEILVGRPKMTVAQMAAPEGTCATLDALAGGAPLGRALPPDADHPAIFATLFAAGALLPPDHV